MDIKPLRSEADYENALAHAEALLDAAPDTADGDQLDILTTLIEAYEQKNFPIDKPDPVEAIKFRMEQGGFRKSDLGAILGSQPRASEILRKKRRLTIDMVHALNKHWGIPAEALISPYALADKS